MTANFYRSNGKLLITGEYAIMFGAEGLALPLNRFQEMHIKQRKREQNKLNWKAYDIHGLWFEAKWLLPQFTLIETSDMQRAEWLISLLKAIRSENPFFLNDGFSYTLTHFCNFNIQWGLGSSSTLLVNLAQWAGVDPFKVYFKHFKGSGYDIACAQRELPFIYTLQNKHYRIETIDFNPPFLEQIFLVYSGNKQNTQQAIAHINAFDDTAIQTISKLTRAFIQSHTIDEAMEIIKEHEHIIARQIGEIPVQEKYFSDFSGQIKSLGAWGGDFWMVLSPMSHTEVERYFASRGYSTVLRLRDLMPQKI
jgi:mevalonate kinase